MPDMECEVDMTTSCLTDLRYYPLTVASPAPAEGVAAHVTHSHRPSKRVNRLSSERRQLCR